MTATKITPSSETKIPVLSPYILSQPIRRGIAMMVGKSLRAILLPAYLPVSSPIIHESGRIQKMATLRAKKDKDAYNDIDKLRKWIPNLSEIGA